MLERNKAATTTQIIFVGIVALLVAVFIVAFSYENYKNESDEIGEGLGTLSPSQQLTLPSDFSAFDNYNSVNPEILENRIIDENGNIIRREIRSDREFEQRDLQQPQKPEFNGYIIEFEDAPIIVEKNRLDGEEKEIKEKNKKTDVQEDNALSTIKGFWFYLTKPAIQDKDKKVKDYSKNLKEKNKITKKKVLDKVKEKRAGKKGKPKTTGNVVKDSFNEITGKAVAEEEIAVLNEFDTAFNGIALDIAEEEAEEIKNIEGVKSVSPNYKVETTLMDSVPLINADNVWKLDVDGNDCLTTGKECLTGKGVTIGIIDTGVDYTHEDLGGCTQAQFLSDGCEKVIGGWDFSNNDNDPIDENGHGTHVASTAAGNGVLKGVAPDAKIYAYKVFPNSFDSVIISAIERSLDPNQDGDFSDRLDVISLSLGGPGNTDDPMSTAIDNVVDAGVVAVISAGNNGPWSYSISSPGTARKAITVGASDKSDFIADFSSRGPIKWTDEEGNLNFLIKPDIIAPGVAICAAQWDSAWNDRKCFDDKHVAISGTSMATPHVSGAVALLKQKHPDWTPQEIKMALRNTAKKLVDSATGNEYYINTQGYGRIEVDKAVSLESKPMIAEIRTNGEVSGIIDIIGTAKGENFKSYTLYYGRGENPSEWIEIGKGNQKIENGILLSNFDTGILSDGYSYLKLIVWNNYGEYSMDKNLIDINNIEITNPLNNDVLRARDIISIKGTVKGNFQNYKIEWASGFGSLDSRTWSSQGITLINSGNQAIINGVLADWDTSFITEPDFYTIKLTKLNNDGSSDVLYVHSIYLDSRIKEKLYISYRGGTNRYPGDYIIGDVNNDKYKEILFVDASGNVDGKNIILNLYDKNLLLMWSRELPNEYYTMKTFLGDMDGDSYKEIFIEMDDYLYAFNHNGEPLEGNWPFTLGYGSISWFSDSIAADVNRDGKDEIVVKTYKDYNYPSLPSSILAVINSSGNIIKSFDINSDSYCGMGRDRSISVGNLDDDDDLEIVIKYGCNGLAAYDLNTGMMNGWPKMTGGLLMGGLATGDINNDNYNEILVSAWNLTISADPSIKSTAGGIYAFNKNAELLWSSLLNRSFIGSGFALGDFNKDKFLEIAIPDDSSKIHILDYNGNEIVSRQANPFHFTTWASPVIADINNDGIEDIIIAGGGIQPSLIQCGISYSDSSGGLWAMKFNGDKIDLNSLNYTDEIYFELWNKEVIALTDLDNNKKTDLILISEYNYNYCPLTNTNAPTARCNSNDKIIDDNCRKFSKNRRTFYIVELNSTFNSSLANWPMFQHDPQHTGCYDCDIDFTQERPQSKISNNENKNITGTLTMKLQKEQNGTWRDEKVVVSQQATIPANGLLKLDTGKDSNGEQVFAGWNNLNISINLAGNYRVYISFEVGIQKFESGWEIEVQ